MSSRYSPESNGVVEGYNPAHLQKAGAMLLEPKSSPKRWDEADLCAPYVMNITTAQDVDNKVPFDMSFVPMPNVSDLRVFGCSAHIGLQAERRSWSCKVVTNRLYVGTCNGFYTIWDIHQSRLV